VDAHAHAIGGGREGPLVLVWSAGGVMVRCVGRNEGGALPSAPDLEIYHASIFFLRVVFITPCEQFFGEQLTFLYHTSTFS
jgi:hypothetical protein